MSSALEPSYQYQHNSCAFCGVRSAEGMRIMFCSKCRIVVYCSKEHQVAHWKRHKKFCRNHVWGNGNPVGGLAAAASCSITVCACKKWHLESTDEFTSSQSLPQSTLSMGPSYSTSYVARGADLNASDPSRSSTGCELSVDLDEKILEKSDHQGQGPTTNMLLQQDSKSFSSAARESTTITGYGDLPINSAFDGNLCSKSHLTLSGSNNKNSYNNSNVSTSTSSSMDHPPQDDLENHAPALYSLVSGSGISQQLPNQSSLLLTGGNITVSSLGPTVCTSNSSTSSLLSPTAKPHQNNLPQNDSQVMIAENNHDDREGLASGNAIHVSTMTNSSTTIPFQHRNNMQPLTGQTSQQTRLWMLQVWKQQVIEDLNRYGVCVVDNLLGDARGASVLREVQSMYSSGAFKDGQLVKGKDVQSKSIRGDKITWVDGQEPNCKNIAVLIKILDNIVMGANNVANNGKLGSYTIKERSKAMVACYPGSGTHYVKHVDNPNDDGRCVTAIYYLNKDWNTRENGGLLRIFPEGWSHQVADIEPLFDRVIFFWSDRRNPHEVQPAFKTRYAITLWYFDSHARARAKLSSESNKLATLNKSLS